MNVAGDAPETNTAHDLGGARGFGAIDISEHNRTAQFADEWEKSVFGMTLACGMLGRWNLDQSRSAREQMESAHYLASSYYEHWLHGLELLLLERGMVSAAELRSGQSAGGGFLPAVAAEQVADILGKGAPTSLPAEADALFTIGERVRVREFIPAIHTRAPRYTRGREAVVVNHHGAHIFPDRHAASGEKQPQHLYSVRFEAQELWGKEEGAGRRPGEMAGKIAGKIAIYADLFEPYLEAADAAT